MCIVLCTNVAHNTAQNRPDNFPTYPLDNHQWSDNVYLREGWGWHWYQLGTRKNQWLASSCQLNSWILQKWCHTLYDGLFDSQYKFILCFSFAITARLLKNNQKESILHFAKSAPQFCRSITNKEWTDNVVKSYRKVQVAQLPQRDCTSP